MLKPNLRSDDESPEIPSCFGKQFERTPECVGGYDPTYSDEETGSHVRDACIWMSGCASRTQAGRNAQQALIPPGNLVRPPPTTFTQPASPTINSGYRPPYASTPAPYQQPRPPSAFGPYPTQHMPPAAVHAPIPQVQYQQMVPVNYMMPQYLSVREPADSGSLFKRLLVEVLRSLGKSAGHTIANFFDSEIFSAVATRVMHVDETSQARPK